MSPWSPKRRAGTKASVVPGSATDQAGYSTKQRKFNNWIKQRVFTYLAEIH